MSHGIETSKCDELAKKICELPSLKNAKNSVSKEPEKEAERSTTSRKLSQAMGGSEALKIFSAGFAKTTHLLDNISKAIRDKNKSTATEIMERL